MFSYITTLLIVMIMSWLLVFTWGNQNSDLYQMFINNLKISYSFGPRRDGDIEQIYANNSFAKVELSWQAEESLENALKSAWKWEKKKSNKL